MEVNQVSGIIDDAAMKVHSALSPRLLESAYEACLILESCEKGACELNRRSPSLSYTTERRWTWDIEQISLLKVLFS